MAKIIIDKEKCLGCGSCVQICPKSFGIKKNKAYIKKIEVGKITCEKDAELSCPAGAISILD